MTANLLVTVDVDHDGVALENERTELTWRGLERLPDIKRLFQSFGAPVTWFVRADNQLRELYGSAGYLHLEHGNLWRDFAATGDEIAWHPHLYRLDEREGVYLLDGNEERCAAKLRQIHAELDEQGLRFQSVRIGEAFHGNALMHTLNGLGLKIDSTAIPGVRRTDETRQFDWSPTPNEPYYPSPDDYRVPGPVGRQLSLLEVPLTTIPVRADYDSAPRRRYINLAYHHSLFKAGFGSYLETETRERDQLTITMILHPEEVLGIAGAHPLYSFSLHEAQLNLTYLLDTLQTSGIQPRFSRMIDLAETAMSNIRS